MKGFDAEFPDLDTYIRVITARIWEGRRLEDIRRYYADPCIVETPTGVTTTAQQVIDGTAATLAMFPDRRLLAEDIIVSGGEDGGLQGMDAVKDLVMVDEDGDEAMEFFEVTDEGLKRRNPVGKLVDS